MTEKPSERTASKPRRSLSRARTLPRSSGILLHPTMLSSPHGIGDLGREAHEFLEWLGRAGQRWWQMLPVTIPTFGDSPYASASSFAGNLNLIDLRGLVDDGFLDARDPLPTRLDPRVDFGWVHEHKLPILREAARRARRLLKKRRRLLDDFEKFKKRERYWIHDYALFSALHAESGEHAFVEWSPQLRDRSPAHLKKARERLKARIEEDFILQWFFDRQWRALRAHADALGVGLIGDLPIFVAHDSADVWAHRSLFRMDESGYPKEVAGVPPDYFSEDGQLWGNPLYDWATMRATSFAWWIERFRAMSRRFHVVRIDHFIGFHHAWHVPWGASTAREGRWKKGPGGALFRALHNAGVELPIIAEDLGALTDEVRSLRDRLGFPGMRVLQFAFGDRNGMNEHLPHNYPVNSVAYTGTHDNDTLVGWLMGLEDDARSKNPDAQKRRAATEALCHLRDYLGAPPQGPWPLIRLLLSSPASVTIFPVQDVLGLSSRARMNRPGMSGGNWTVRLHAGALKEKHETRLREMSILYGRRSKEG